MINCVCFLDNWRLILGITELKKNKKLIILYEFINGKKNLIIRLVIENEFREKINCILKLGDEKSNNSKFSKNIAVCGKDPFIKILNIDLYQDKYKLLQKIYVGENNFLYTMVEMKNKYLILGQFRNITILKKVVDFSKYNISSIYKKVFEVSTNNPTINITLHNNNRDFITLQSKIQQIIFYENLNYDISLEGSKGEVIYLGNDEGENDNNHTSEDNGKNSENDYFFQAVGNIKFISNVLNIYMLASDILGCNDEESVFLINVKKKVIVAQILLGLKIFCSRVTYDLSLIFSAYNKKSESRDQNETELIQYKLNNEKDNMVRLRNSKKNIRGVDNIFCLENNSIIFFNSKKISMTIVKSKK